MLSSEVPMVLKFCNVTTKNTEKNNKTLFMYNIVDK